MDDSLDASVLQAVEELDEPLASLPSYDEACCLPDYHETEEKKPFPNNDYYNLAEVELRKPKSAARHTSRDETEVKRQFHTGAEEVHLTSVKLPHGDSDDESATHLKTPESSHDIDQMDVKPFCSPDDVSSGEESDGDDGVNELPTNEREELLGMIQKMQAEQERQREEQKQMRLNQERKIQELKRQQRREHEEVMRRQVEQFKQFEEYVKSKPRLSKKVKSIKRNSQLGFAGAALKMQATSNAAKQFSFSRNQIYVQIQTLYSNMHRMTLVSRETVAGESGDENGSIYETIADVMNTPDGETDRTHVYVEELRSRVTELKREKEELAKDIIQLKRSVAQLQAHGVVGPDTHRPHIARTRSEETSSSDSYGYLEPFTPSQQRQRIPPKPHNPPRLVSVPVEATFQWTLTDYFKKLKLEQENVGKRQLSHHFYIHHKSYRCQLEAYLNGNGLSAHGRCMSIFLRVVKGDYDDVLSWPVELNPTFILVNQADKNDSIKATGNIDKFFCYRKCSNNEAEASDVWGLIKFVTHEMIHQGGFIKDNTLQLQCRIAVVREPRAAYMANAIATD